MTAPVIAYTDGSCHPNPGGPGGWAVVIVEADGTRREAAGSEASSTNNRMEMQAALEALRRTVGPVVIRTDSAYLRDGITRWIKGWRRNGWRTRSRQPVKNADLWRELDAARTGRDVTWAWIKGHAGHAENERADELAGAARRAHRAERRGRMRDLVEAAKRTPDCIL